MKFLKIGLKQTCRFNKMTITVDCIAKKHTKNGGSL